jgi:hypothetical protein
MALHLTRFRVFRANFATATTKRAVSLKPASTHLIIMRNWCSYLVR